MQINYTVDLLLCLLSSLEIVEAWCGMDKQQQNSTVSLLSECLHALLFNATQQLLVQQFF